MEPTESDGSENSVGVSDVVYLQLFTEQNLSSKYGIPEDEVDWKTNARKMLKRKCACSSKRVKKFFFTIIPILQWLPKYNVKENLIGDIAAGLIVGIVHIPQGMAYALLASLPPVTGLYTSFLPVLVYVLFGTSRHVSIGTFAVISLMVGQAIDNHVKQCSITETESGVTATATSFLTTLPNMESATNVSSALTKSTLDLCEKSREQRQMEVAVALALASGVIQIIMFIFRLGVVTIYMSDHLVSAFTCSAAVYVMTSQVPKLLGLTIKRYSGPLALIYTYIDIFKNITLISWPTVIVSLCCIVFLVVGKEISARFREKLPVPFPWELFVVIFSTIASYFGHISSNYDVSVVGNIPTGIQTSMPTGSDIGMVLVDAIPIAIVTYAIEISLCQMFAVKHSYKVDSNQELLALGLGNIVGAFFNCYPSAGSLSRSVIWEEAGAKTQLTGIVSSGVILLVLLWIAPLFESVPQAALAAIIVVNLKGLLRQFDKVKPLWNVSTFDALTWVVTWIVVILLGVELGLLVAVCFALLTIIFRTQIESGVVLGNVGGTGIYRGRKDYVVETEENILIFQFPGPIHYANRNRFKTELTQVLGFDPIMMSSKSKNKNKNSEKANINEKAKRTYSATENAGFEPDTNIENGEPTSPNEHSEYKPDGIEDEHKSYGNGTRSSGKDEVSISTGSSSSEQEIDVNLKYLILDMSATTFLDNDGAQTIRSVHTALKNLNVNLFLVACNESVRHVLTVVCSEQRPPFFLSIGKAREFARGETDLILDEIGNVVDQDVEDTRL